MQEYMLWVWIGAFVLFLIAEAATAQLTTIWFAVGALVALVLEIAGVESITVQFIVFAVVSVAVLIATRPLVKRAVNNKKEATNADRYIGETTVTLERIDNIAGTGSVKLGSSVWSARSCDGTCIEKDRIVKVEKMEGVKVFVRPVEGKKQEE